MEYYSALKQNEIFTHRISWINFEDTILNEMSQHRKTNTVGLHLLEASVVVRFM